MFRHFLWNYGLVGKTHCRFNIGTGRWHTMNTCVIGWAAGDSGVLNSWFGLQLQRNRPDSQDGMKSSEGLVPQCYVTVPLDIDRLVPTREPCHWLNNSYYVNLGASPCGVGDVLSRGFMCLPKIHTGKLFLRHTTRKKLKPYRLPSSLNVKHD